MQRLVVDVESAPGGWPRPWPNVAELALALPPGSWTLIGGLMTQLHTVHRGLGVVRPTEDVDIALHIETVRGVPSRTANVLESIGYRLRDGVDPRDNTAHRWVRGNSAIDVSSGAVEDEVVDVLRADHPAPKVIERMRGRDMIGVEGGTQALRRTMNARLEIVTGTITVVSVPQPLGAVVMKAAAYRTDSRNQERHLFDAAALLACVADPFEERKGLRGSDRSRLIHLGTALDDRHPAWTSLRNDAAARAGRQALTILTMPPRQR